MSIFKYNTIELGKFEVKNGCLTATDPLRYDDVQCITIKNVKNGYYRAFVNKIVESNDGSDIDKISRLTIVHEDYFDNWSTDGICPTTYISSADIDAGVFGFFENKPNYNSKKLVEICCEAFYNECCGIAHKNNVFECEGAWSDSGFGAGTYPIYVASDDEIVCACIDYIF